MGTDSATGSGQECRGVGEGFLSTAGLLDLLDHAVEPEPWECDEPWEYRAMHWRPSERVLGARSG